MAQRRSPSSRKSKAKPKTTRAKAAKTAKPKGKTKAKAKAKSTAKRKALPKAAKPRRAARGAASRAPQRKTRGRRPGFDKMSRIGVETRPQDMDPARREPGFAYEESPRASADESFSPGNYEPGNIGEPKAAPRRRGVANRAGDGETETMPGAGPRASTDGAAEPAVRQERSESD